MESKIYALDKAQYRIIEKENKAGKKFYFLQRCMYGFHYYKRKWYSFWKKTLIKSEIEWVYLYEQKDKGQYSNDYFNCILTKNHKGKDIPIDLNLYVDKACKSREDAVQLMHEHIGWVKWLEIKKVESKKEEEDEKLNDEKEIIIPLHDFDGKIKESYQKIKKQTIYDNTAK